MGFMVRTVDEILEFQTTFLQELEKAIDSETEFQSFDEISEFQVGQFVA